ncbi:unnamed protein product [Ixodes pacificus]
MKKGAKRMKRIINEWKGVKKGLRRTNASAFPSDESH